MCISPGSQLIAKFLKLIFFNLHYARPERTLLLRGQNYEIFAPERYRLPCSPRDATIEELFVEVRYFCGVVCLEGPLTFGIEIGALKCGHVPFKMFAKLNKDKRQHRLGVLHWLRVCEAISEGRPVDENDDSAPDKPPPRPHAYDGEEFPVVPEHPRDCVLLSPGVNLFEVLMPEFRDCDMRIQCSHFPELKKS